MKSPPFSPITADHGFGENGDMKKAAGRLCPTGWCSSSLFGSELALLLLPNERDGAPFLVQVECKTMAAAPISTFICSFLQNAIRKCCGRKNKISFPMGNKKFEKRENGTILFPFGNKTMEAIWQK